MNSENKKKIIEALEAYMFKNQVSQNDIAKFTEVNAGYLIRMRAGYEDIKIGVKVVPFKAEAYNRIAGYIGFELVKKTIETKPTKQYVEIISALKDSKEHSEVAWIIAETGAGKTYALNAFQRKYPSEVFTVKLAKSDNFSDVLMKIAEALRLDYFKGSKSAKVRLIVQRLSKLKREGLQPILNLDEAEFATAYILCAYKDIFDALLGICPVNLIGTPDLLDKINKLVMVGKEGMPQLYRRIKFKIKRTSPIDKKYPLFLEGVEPELAQYLRQNCNNYGELTDVLTPCIRESERTGKPLTLENVEMFLGL